MEGLGVDAPAAFESDFLDSDDELIDESVELEERELESLELVVARESFR